MKKMILGMISLLVTACQADEKSGQRKDRDDWPVARGGAGLSGQVGVGLPPKPDIMWMVQTEGAIVGETVVSKDIVVFGNSAGLLTAVDLKSGKKKWQREFEQSFEAAPAILDDTIFIGCEDMKLYALELETGQ